MPTTQDHHVPKRQATTAERAEDTVRYAITGDRRGALRRIVLYVITALAMGVLFSASAPAVHLQALVAGLVALTALLLLAMTDQLA